MTVKLILLKSHEMLITDLKDVRSGDDALVGYLLNKPHTVMAENQNSMYLTESNTPIDNTPPNQIDEQGKSFQIIMTPWIFLTSEQDIFVKSDWIVTIVEPLEEISKMYMEKVNGRPKV